MAPSGAFFYQEATLSRQANGTYLQPANTAAVSGQTISSTAFNTLITDIGTEITNSLDRGGRSSMTAPLPMGGQRITGLAEPIVSSDAATKNYADTITAAFFSTGDMKPTLKTVPDSGWIMMFDQTIGNAGSGAVSGGPQMLALFTLIWNNISAPSGNTLAPVSGGLGASAAADWAGLKVLTLPLSVGRVIGNSANGGTTGLTQRILGRSVGAETAALSTANLPPYTPAGTITNGAITSTTPQAGGTASTTMAGTTTSSIVGATSIIITSTQAASTFTGSPQGGTSAAFQIMQPSLFVNWMIKL